MGNLKKVHLLKNDDFIFLKFIENTSVSKEDIKLLEDMIITKKSQSFFFFVFRKKWVGHIQTN